MLDAMSDIGTVITHVLGLWKEACYQKDVIWILDPDNEKII